MFVWLLAIKGQADFILGASGVLCESCYGAMILEQVLAKKSNLTFPAISPFGDDDDDGDVDDVDHDYDDNA